jgi:HAD superfamily hydrolase (TIGR01549 family)
MRFNIYIFDLDGTLLNLGDLGVYADKILFETLISLNTPNIPGKEERRSFFSSHLDYIKILQKWGVSKPENFWHQYDKVDFEIRKDLIKSKAITLFKDVESVLEKIFNHDKSKKVAIVSNTADYIINYFLKYFKIIQYFHEIFGMNDNNQQSAKPSPSGINLILSKFNYDPTNNTALMIGDSIVDIIAAKKANICSCLINRTINSNVKNYNSWQYQPDYVIEDLHELLVL